MVSRAYHLQDSDTFAQKALQWAAQFESACYLDSNGYRDNYGNINVFLAVGPADSYIAPHNGDTFSGIQQFVDAHPNTWIPGFFGYDLKNEVEELGTRHPNQTGFPDAYFFVPTATLLIGRYNVEIKGEQPDDIIAAINAIEITDEPLGFKGKLRYRMNRRDYVDAFDNLQHHIQQGDIYEVNLCQEFYAENTSINPLEAYKRLNTISPTPFSCFFRHKNHYILSASPERFLSKNGNTLLSQPIKGTAPRGKEALEDQQNKETLVSNPKEVSENIMIVDLVRNDLTKSAKPGTVKAPKLLDVQSFRQVHQLISTITCQVDERLTSAQVIKNTFPPGSMTGAPKISAMKLIDQYEKSRRGIYAGGLGYFGPQGNFDFSVVIRTLLYNADTGYLSFHTGGAITAGADPEKEYDECLLKGKAIFEMLKTQD